ncbi:MAG: hypothetical protein ABW040_08995 [Microbacteriaceae bacterium]
MRRLAVLPLAAVSLLALAGCSALYDYPHAEVENLPAEVAEPGSTHAPGDAVRILDRNAESEISVTVRAMVEGDKSIYNELSNGEEFQDFVPYHVVFQFDPTEELPDGEQVSAPSIYGVLANGEDASSLVEDNVLGSSVCPYTLERNQNAPYRFSCMTYLVPEGETLGNVGWYNVSDGTIMSAGDPDSPYLESPVIWEWAPTES